MSDELRRASLLVEQANSAPAREILVGYVADRPDSARAWCLLACCHNLDSDWAAMLTAADRALTIAPYDEWAHRLQAIALRHLGRFDQAVDAARRAIAHGPQVWANHTTLAEVLLARRRRGDVREAYQATRHALDIAPDRPDVHVALGSVFASAGNAVGARRAYRQALSLDAGHRAALNNVAVGDMRRGRPVAALVKLRRAWAQAPQHRLYRRNLAALVGSVLLTLLLAGSLLDLGMLAFVASRPIPGVRLAVGLVALAGYLAGCILLLWRLLRLEPRLLSLAHAGVRSRVGHVLTGLLVLAEMVLLALLALQPPLVDSPASALVGVPLGVLLLAIIMLVSIGLRAALGWVRLRSVA
jgi:Flp pilus assembly protein TadD